jgi:diguanylate cyclase (GGDEF)-like protein
MISLKKHIDSWQMRRGESPPEFDTEAYRSLITAFADCSSRAVPELGEGLHHKLNELAEAISGHPVTAEQLEEVHQKIEGELTQWSEQAHECHETNERELKQVVDVMAEAVVSVTQNDERHAREFVELADRLRALTSLNDIAQIRRSIIEGATSLTECVERQAKASQESLKRLSAQVEDYRSRLDKSEQLSSVDPLTGLANRRRFEELLEAKVKSGKRFCLILMDLDDFKEINDQLGHLAGDELLKSFADKLQSQFPSAELVARWGGDEFAIILTTNVKDAEARVNRLRISGLGECKINTDLRPVWVAAEASIGVVEWNGVENSVELVGRADRAMYVQKSRKTRNARQ